MSEDQRRRVIDVMRCHGCPSDVAAETTDALLPVVTSWDWLMGILAEHYPPDVFTGDSGDPGPQIVALTREVYRLQRVEQLERANRAMEHRLLDLRAGLAELLGQAEHMTDNELLETATIVIRGAQ